ncbi:MAG: peptidase MA family metallohydrolase [Candidatus Hydrogenedentota bacterium]
MIRYLTKRRLLFWTFFCVAGAGIGYFASAEAMNTEAAEYNALGVEHYNRGEWPEAIDAFLNAKKSAPRNPTIRDNLVNAYQAYANEVAEQRDFATAAEIVKQAVSHAPDNPAPLVQLGMYSLRLDRVSDAIFRLEEAVELDPSNLDALEVLGDAYYQANDLAAALAVWREVHEEEPDRPNLAERIAKAQREADVERSFQRSGSRHFEITYPRQTTGREQQQVLSILERGYRELGQIFGNVFPPPPIQVIIYSAEEFSAATELDEHVGAVYDGKIRVPVRDRDGETLEEDELERRLYHEYAHVMVRHLGGEDVPWWFNEGLAEMLSTSLTDEDHRRLHQAQQDGALFYLRALDDSPLDELSPEQLRLAYLQSHAAVDYLWRRFGQGSLLNYIEALSEGYSGEAALREVYHRTYHLLEGEVADEIRR